ncbi:MAG: DivIVA domain-containing protein, partial [Clostridia bacterium]|nr:DivIVA domain-containing protein [Clostridia bacterium]
DAANNSTSNEKVAELNATIASQKAEIEKLKKEVKENVNDGKAISEALIVAQRQAEKIVAEANEKSAKIIKDANDKADYIEKDADAQKKKVLTEIDKLEKEQMATRKEYQVMLRDIITAMDKRLTQSEGLSAKKSPASTGATKPAASATSKNNAVKPANTQKNDEAKAAPVKPEPQKDFSGFGDTDFDDDKID